MTRGRKRWLVGLLLSASALGGAMCLTIYPMFQVARQERLNHTLTVAITKNDAAAVTRCLSQRADPNARDLPVDPRPIGKRLWDRFRGVSYTPISDPDSRSGKGEPALRLALAPDNSDVFPPRNPSLIRALVDAGANVNAADKRGNTPLVWAVMDGNIEVVRLLLDRGALVNSRDVDGRTPLHTAMGDADVHDLAMVQLLLARGASVNAQTNVGTTPLHIAAFNGSADLLPVLLKAGATVNAHNKDGETPLAYAVEGDYGGHAIACVQLLIAAGADVQAHDGSGQTLLTLARKRQDGPVVRLLKQAGAK